MTFNRLFRFLPFIGAALLGPATNAQETTSAADDEARAAVEAQGFRLPPQLRQIAYREANPWVLHTNVRVGEADSSVTFGGLGEIPFRAAIPGADISDILVRVYDDGAVFADGPREEELDGDGNQITTPGERYQLFSEDGTLTDDLLAYTPGVTRQWEFLNPGQVGDGVIAMNQFSTRSSGASLQRDAETSGIGFEMSVSRRVMRLGERFELSVSGSVGFSDFNSSTSSTITADLVTLTDTYQLFGPPPLLGDIPYTGPDFGPLFVIGPSGLPEATGINLESTIPLQQVTEDRQITTLENGATVSGNWGLDGAYYSFRIGPEIRGHLTPRIAFKAGAGLLGAVVGSDFSANESLVLGDYRVFGNSVAFNETDSLTELVLGYYAEAAIEYWITQRTGVFIGAVLESIDDFDHIFGGRTASVVLGEALVLRVGIVHRF